MFASTSLEIPQKAAELLNCRRLPGRLSVAEAATILGFPQHDIPVLIAARLLTPLGKPAKNAPKYFAAVHVQELSQDMRWLAKATNATTNNWRIKNARRVQS